MSEHIQPGPSQRPQNPAYEDRSDLSFRRPSRGVPGWVWFIVGVAVCFMLCGGLAVGSAMFWVLGGVAPSPPPPPMVQPMPPPPAQK